MPLAAADYIHIQATSGGITQLVEDDVCAKLGASSASTTPLTSVESGCKAPLPKGVNHRGRRIAIDTEGLEAFAVIVFDVDAGRFNYRVAGVCVHAGHVLLHQAAGDDFSALPGGRPELGEDSRTALAREMHEELGVEIVVRVAALGAGELLHRRRPRLP